MRPVSAAFSYETEFNTETLPLLSTHTRRQSLNDYVTDAGSHNVSVTNADSDSVSVIDVSTNAVTATVPV
jgi:hypothetical protein